MVWSGLLVLGLGFVGVTLFGCRLAFGILLCLIPWAGLRVGTMKIVTSRFPLLRGWWGWLVEGRCIVVVVFGFGVFA